MKAQKQVCRYASWQSGWMSHFERRIVWTSVGRVVWPENRKHTDRTKKKLFPVLRSATHTLLTEAEFLDVIGTKVFTELSSLLFPITSTNGCKSDLKLVCNVNIVYKKPQVGELSRLCPETSTKLYVHEFGFRSQLQILYLTDSSYIDCKYRTDCRTFEMQIMLTVFYILPVHVLYQGWPVSKVADPH